jgi:hypothetical protein
MCRWINFQFLFHILPKFLLKIKVWLTDSWDHFEITAVWQLQTPTLTDYGIVQWFHVTILPLKDYSRLTRHDVPAGGLTLIVGTQKWGFSCKVQRRPPADIIWNGSLPPITPCNTMFMTAMAMVLPWKIVEDYQSFVKNNTKLWPSLKKKKYLVRKWV